MSCKAYLHSLWMTGGMLLLGSILGQARLHAQEEPAKALVETAKIVTADGVRLNAVFYPSPSKNSATVILLHPIGEGKSIKLEGWKKLAETLQKQKFSVLMFDFRGHGESTEITDTALFWSFAVNKNCVRASTKERDTIEYKDFKKAENAYLPVLVNDIAAVKAFLERKNDAGVCNTANTIVIGAENGATLGAVWINSEWNRYRLIPPPPMMFLPPQLDKRAEGNHIIGAVWLNISPSLGSRKVSVAAILNNACKLHAMPCVFLYGEKDTAAKKYNVFLADTLKVKNSKKHEGIVQAEVSNTKLTGVKLLTEGLKTDDFIGKYLEENVLAERNNEWESHEFQNTSYVWRDTRTNTPVPAKIKSEKLFKFDLYEKYLLQ